MRKIEQSKSDMAEIYSQVIYPGFGCATMIKLQIDKLEGLKNCMSKEGSNKELNKVLVYDIDKVIKGLQAVEQTLDKTMGEALIGLAPNEFLKEIIK